MKLLTSALLLVALVLPAPAYPQPASIVGKWAIFDWNERSRINTRVDDYVIFRSDMSVVITVTGDELPPASYSLNTRTVPLQIEATITSPDGLYKLNLHGLFEFIDDNTAKFQFFTLQSGQARPAQFTAGPTNGITAGPALVRRLDAADRVISSSPLDDPNVPTLAGLWEVYPWSKRFEINENVPTWEFSGENSFRQTGTFFGVNDQDGRYILDSSHNPGWLDLSSPEGTLKGLYEKLSADELKVEFFPNLFTSEHPASFSDVEFGSDTFLVDKNIFYVKRRLADTAGSTVASVQNETLVPVKVTASSVYPTDNSSYFAEHTIDKVPGTAWFPERTDRTNVGQWLRFDFDNAVDISRLGFINGWARDEEVWNSNSRVKIALVVFSSGNEIVLHLADHSHRQDYAVPGSGSSWAKIIVVDCYTNPTSNEVGISEVYFER